MGYNLVEKDVILTLGSAVGINAETDVRPSEFGGGGDHTDWLGASLAFRVSKTTGNPEWIVRGVATILTTQPATAAAPPAPDAGFSYFYAGWNYNELNPYTSLGAEGWNVDFTTKEGGRVVFKIQANVTGATNDTQHIRITTLAGHDTGIEVQLNIIWVNYTVGGPG